MRRPRPRRRLRLQHELEEKAVRLAHRFEANDDQLLTHPEPRGEEAAQRAEREAIQVALLLQHELEGEGFFVFGLGWLMVAIQMQRTNDQRTN